MGIEDFMEFRDVDSVEDRMAIIYRVVEESKSGDKSTVGKWNEKLGRIEWRRES
jgi:hypothetical protein